MIVLVSMMKMHVQLVSKKQRIVNTDGQDVASHGYTAKCFLLDAKQCEVA